jgi:hypothetical protein
MRRDDQHETVATAAARSNATREVSPELALVDAALAEELRASFNARPESGAVALRAVSIPTTDVEPNEPIIVEIAPWPTEPSSGDDASDLIVGAVDDEADKPETTSGDPASPETPAVDNHSRAAAAAAPDDVDASHLIVARADHAAEETEATSRYPALPAPEGAATDPMEAAEEALREIRARLGGEARETRRRLFRTRFAVALGATTLVAFAVLVADLYYGIAELPS